MSDHAQGPEPPRPDEGRTEEYPTMAGTLAAPEAPVVEPLPDGDDADEEWVVQTTRGIRLAVPVAALLALVFVAAGFCAGAVLEKHHASSSGGVAGLAARFRSARAGASGTTTGTTSAGGFGFGGGGFGGSTAAATGTISVVDGDTLYILSAAGSLVKVTLTPSTTITRDAQATPTDLRPGDTVVVQGTTSANGNVAATSLTATAPGVTAAGGGGFGGFGAGGAATGTTTTGAAGG